MSQSPFGGKVIGSRGRYPTIAAARVAIAFRREGDWKSAPQRAVCKIASRNRLSAGR